MMTRTIEHAVNNAFGPRADAAADQFNAALERADFHAREARRELIEHLEFGTYVVAGAIFTGFLILAVLARTGN